MSDRLRNIIVGTTMILGIVGIAVMMLLFGYAPAWFERGYAVTIEMTSAAGLAAGSRARMSGTDVGRVASVRLAEPPKWGVELLALIRPDVRLPDNVRVSVDSPMLGGSPALTFAPPPEPTGQLLAHDGTARIVVNRAVPTLASQFAAELRSALAASVGDLRAELQKAQENIGALSSTWVEVGKNVNELVKPRHPSAVDSDQTGQTVGNVATVLARADARLRQLESVLDGLRAWVSDEALRRSTRELVANAGGLAVKMDAGVDRLVHTAESAGASFNQLVARFTDVAGELSGAVRSLRKTMEVAATGQGTVGRALNDPSLYNNLNDAAERLSQTLDEIKMLVEKWQTEGLPVKF